MAIINKPSQPLIPAEIDPAVLDSKADLVNGAVPSTQLPSYVDDVLEFANFAAFPKEGETGKIYVALDANSTYRWSGVGYVQVGGDSNSTPPTIQVSFSDEQLPSSALDPRILALTTRDDPIVCLIDLGGPVEVGTIAADKWRNQFLYRFRCANGFIVFVPDAVDPDTEEPAFSVHFEDYSAGATTEQIELLGNDLENHTLSSNPFNRQPGASGYYAWLIVPSTTRGKTYSYYGLVTLGETDNEIIFFSQNGQLTFHWDEKTQQGSIDVSKWRSAEYLQPTLIGIVGNTEYHGLSLPVGSCEFRVTFPSGAQCTYSVGGVYDSEKGETHYLFEDPNTEIIITDDYVINWDAFHEQDPGYITTPFDPTILPTLEFHDNECRWPDNPPQINWPASLPAGPLTPNIVLALYLTGTPELQYGYATVTDTTFTIYPLDDQFQLMPGIIINAMPSTNTFQIDTSHIVKSFNYNQNKYTEIRFVEEPGLSDGMLILNSWAE